MTKVDKLARYDFKDRLIKSKQFVNSKGIYLLFRKDNDKCIYVGRTIGKTSSISKRLESHFTHPTEKLKNCIKAASGKISFSCIIMDDENEEYIKKKETELIKKFNTLRYGNAKNGDIFE